MHLTEPRLRQVGSTSNSVFLSLLLFKRFLLFLSPLSVPDICAPCELFGPVSVGSILDLVFFFVGSFIDKSPLSHEILVMVQIGQIRQYPALVHGGHLLVPDPAAPDQLQGTGRGRAFPGR